MTLIGLNTLLGVVAGPSPSLFVQPDGTTFTGVTYGDEFLARSETEDGYTFLWEDLRNPYGFYSQRLNSNGDRLWGSDDVTVTTHQAVPSNYDITTDNLGGIIIAWYEDTSFYISLLQISVNRNLGEVLLGIDGSNSTDIPGQFHLNQNYPNPFNPVTVISYELPVTGKVSLTIFDVLGSEVITLVNGEKPAGYQSVKWSGKNSKGTNVSSGVYIYRVSIETVEQKSRFSGSRKILLLR